jgi:hypothetical protein
LVLGTTPRSLRTKNVQRAHPYIRLAVPVEPLRSKLRTLCASYGFRARYARADGQSAVRTHRSELSRHRGVC